MTKRTVGSGITAREVFDIPPGEVPKRLRQMDEFVRREGFFEFAARPWADGCRDTLEGVASDDEFPDDHPVDFARRILRAYEISKLHIGSGDADRAARWAFLAGHLAGLAQLKFDWEHHALAGESLARRVEETIGAGNRQRTESARRAAAKWLPEALEKMRAKSWSASRTATWVREQPFAPQANGAALSHRRIRAIISGAK